VSLAGLRRAMDAVDRVLAAGAGLAVIAMMMIVGADVVLRYAFAAPIPWSYDFISIFLINLILYFSFSETLRTGHHMALDLALPASWTPVARAISIVGWLVVIAGLALWSWVALRATWSSALGAEVIPGRFEWPVWLKTGIVAVGAVTITLRALIHLFTAPHGRNSEREPQP